MPTPIGHALGGLIVGLALARAGGAGRSGHADPTTATQPTDRTFLAVCAAVACLPDSDFFWGRHNMETHSLGFAVGVGAAAWAWTRGNARLAWACALAVGTHVLFDWLGSDDFPPLGVMALWPISADFYFADAFIFEAISRRYWLPGFVSHNLLAILREMAILLPIVAGVWWLRKGLRR